ncbi:MAG: DNA polymerase IV [Chitinivibrionales bacterium]|nr:DNA polymerase IV [Chitinivibrionales bacterium]MBD3396693.1 DNA polymerase IV [Chitinivibrionales bacterium]
MTPPVKTIFHADMDAFYASIEQRDNPSYRGKPVIVGARPGSRGVVSAASYEARRFGIRSAIPIAEAYRRCPEGVYVRPRMQAYVRESRAVMAVFRSFSPLVEPLSVDEAFIDMTGTERLWGAPPRAAEVMQRRIREERHLTVSIGVAPNMFLAKLASDLHKPEGITLTPFDPEKVREWLAPMPVARLWGVGPKTQEALLRRGMRTIRDLQEAGAGKLEALFGEHGRHLAGLAEGIDSRDVAPGEDIKSISREHTFPADSADRAQWREMLLTLSRDVASRARAQGVKGSTVVLTYRTPDFKRHSRRTTLAAPTDLTRRIFEEAAALLHKQDSSLKALRLIGVGITNLGGTVQTDLFAAAHDDAWEASETAMDSIAERYGDSAIFLGGEGSSRMPRRK